MMYRLGLLIGLCLALGEVGSAQRIDSFSTVSTEAFFDDFDGFLNASKRDRAADLTKALKRRRTSYTPEQQADIMAVTSAMLETGMSPAPYFEDYLEALSKVPYQAEKAETFANWHNALGALIGSIEKRRFKGFNNFLDFSTAFFSNSSLRSSGGLTWYARSNRFDMSVVDGEPVVKFDTLNLVGVRRSDSIVISATRGRYLPTKTTFEGQGGRVYWDRLGLTDTYVYLDDYEIDVMSSLYKADSVKMTYPTYFGDKRVLGKFADKISSTSGDRTGSYPRFTSYESVLELSDIGEGLTYRGGFRLQGLTVFGDSQGGPPASVELRNEAGKLLYRGVADAFVIRRGERIVGSSVRSAFYHSTDSIVHPSVKLRYDIPDRLLTLSRGERAADRNPFYSSTQDVNVDVEEVKIYVDRDSVIFGEKKLAVAKGSNNVSIESLQYFSGGAYNRYQNIATYNPLSVIKSVAEREGRELDGAYLAQKIDSRFSLESVQSLYFDLVSDGFIDFDMATGQVFVKDKIFHFVDASQGKVDFDAMRIQSETSETNAAFDLNSGAMMVNGVKQLELSRKQRVALIPRAKQLTMQGNRNIDFAGQLYAGYAVMFGKDMHFDYDPYLIRLDSVRYLDLFIPQPGEPGKKRPEPIGLTSRIEKVAGTLLIDAPRNKAGREDIAIFPSLQTSEPCFVYYDYPSIHDTAYTRDSFYFQLNEFSFNSLDNYEEEDIRFKGSLYSADIFPVYEEDIYVRQEDRSLGHATDTAPEGWPTYQRKGTFAGNLDLSNRGYYGEGTLKYLTATINAEDFLFKPKQMLATAEAFDMVEDRTGTPETPEAHGVDVSIDWLPYRDSMYVRSEEEPFDLFAVEGHTLEGRLILTPSGLKGQGVHDWPLATLRSTLLDYGAFAAGGDTLALAIKTSDGEGIALEASNLNGTTDFDASKGSYKANDEFLVVDLPANLYQTSMNEFDWDIASQEISFRSEPGKLGRFLSADPARDSLFFEGETARYNLAGSALEIGGVPYIASADAFIYTSDGAVSIGEGGEMATLTNARIIADTLTRYHEIDSATVNVFGRKDYTARGYYRYDLPNKEQRVLFAEVIGQRVGKGSREEKAAITRASGEVQERKNFYIDDRLKFKGIIALDASREALEFDGFAKFDAPGLARPRWFSVSTLGDKNDLRIPYDLPKAPEGDDLHTGIYLSREFQVAYPVAFMPTHTGQDRYLIDVSEGLLDYRPKKGAYLFGDSARVMGATNRGNYMELDVETGDVSVEGRFELANEVDYISVRSAGRASTSFKGEGGSRYASLNTEALVSIDLIIPDKLLNLVAADIEASGFDAPDVDYSAMTSFLPNALLNWQESTDTANVAAARSGGLVLPKGEQKHSFIFPRVELVYNGDYQSFFSKSNRLDVGIINGAPINKRIEGYIELKMPGSGDDRVYIYLKSPSGAWYFFGFKQGILNVASSSERFMESLEGTKSKELILKMDDGELYEISPVNPGSVNSFVNRVKEGQKG